MSRLMFHGKTCLPYNTEVRNWHMGEKELHKENESTARTGGPQWRSASSTHGCRRAHTDWGWVHRQIAAAKRACQSNTSSYSPGNAFFGEQRCTLWQGKEMCEVLINSLQSNSGVHPNRQQPKQFWKKSRWILALTLNRGLIGHCLPC